MTECTQSSFEFQAHFSRDVVARFDGGTMTSDAGAVLLRETDRRLNLLPRFGDCFEDHRQPWLTSHSVKEMVAQRVHGMALGYEDLNDHDLLREDPLLAVLSGKAWLGEELLAGKSTLNRLELGGEKPSRHKKIQYRPEAIDELLTQVFVEAHGEAPQQVVLDLDTTDLPVEGHQEGRFFHGYYDSYCYLPLYIFAGEHLLCARLRTADQDAAAGSTGEVKQIVSRIRAAWPAVRIIVRADSGFCREELIKWCEENGVWYVIGFARNERLRRVIEPQMQQAAQIHARPANPHAFLRNSLIRRHGQLGPGAARGGQGRTTRRQGESPVRGDQPSAEDWPAQRLYEDLYCERGEMENRIKEQLSLFAGRVSAESMRANQLRVYFAAMAYVLMHGLRRLGLQGTELETAQATTIRLRLLKIGAQIRITARRVWLSMGSSYPLQGLFGLVYEKLRPAVEMGG